MNQHNQGMEPKMEQDKVGAMARLDIMLEVRRIEMQFRGKTLIYAYLGEFKVVSESRATYP